MTHPAFSRRALLAAGTSVAALAAGVNASAGDATTSPRRRNPAAAPQPPFDSLRDYVAALDAHGLLLRLPEIDQDAYELTGLVYRANDQYGFTGVPAIWVDRIKIDGRWVEGPLLNLLQANLHSDAIVFGQPVVPGEAAAGYRAAKALLGRMLEANKGRYPSIAPVTVTREQAPCKEVVLRGDEIDLTRYAFIQTNPGDAGRYINATSVFTSDRELGVNFGTYRCQLRGPRLIGLNPEENQAGWKALMAAKARGEKVARVAIALGQDPIVWLISCSRVVPRFGDKPIDELAVAGGLRGKPLEVVKCETSDLLVPAHCEMIIEGEVPLDERLPEGPFGEMFGYMGAGKAENFFVNVTCVTHRQQPWFVNMYTGLQRGMVTAPSDAMADHLLRQSVPAVVESYLHQDTMGVYFVSVDKTAPGQGMQAAMTIAKFVPIAKVVIAVDKDIDILDKTQVLFALGSRWQSVQDIATLQDQRGLITDPSPLEARMTDKLIIDATRQLPGEDGRAEFPATNRALLVQAMPEVFAVVDRRYRTQLLEWGKAQWPV